MPTVRSSIAGYEITGVLVEGKNSTVYAGIDHRTRWEVAVKTVSRGMRRYRRRRRQLRWEFRLRDRLQHPNIIHTYEFGRTRMLAYLAMDLVHGSSLRGLIRSDDPVLREHPEEIIRQMVAGLTHAHQNGVVHRDIKPENVLVAPTESGVDVKLIDFAIAILYERRWRQWLSGLRRRRGLVGTKTYMSPEQIRRKPLDPRSDIYSLGIVMYEIAAGRPPFLDIDADHVLEAHLETEPPPISRFQPEVNPAFEELVATMIRKDRNLRPPQLSFVQKQLHEIDVFRTNG